MNIDDSTIYELCNATAAMLCDCYHAKANSGIVFPKYRSDSKRISEQEARFAFYEQARNRGLACSIETPTGKEYSFSGTGRRSAATDLSLHDTDNPADILWRVEFKALQPTQSAITKDMEKLVTESEPGLFLHVFENTNANTIQTLLDKFSKAFEHKKVADGRNTRQQLVFCIIVLATRHIYTATLKSGQDDRSFFSNIEEW